MIEPVKFDAELRSLKSCVDHTYTLTLNIPEYNLEQVQELMGMLGDMVAVAMVKADGNQEEEKYKKYQ